MLRLRCGEEDGSSAVEMCSQTARSEQSPLSCKNQFGSQFVERRDLLFGTLVRNQLQMCRKICVLGCVTRALGLRAIHATYPTYFPAFLYFFSKES